MVQLFLNYLQKVKESTQGKRSTKGLEPTLRVLRNCGNTYLVDFISKVCEDVWPYTDEDWANVSSEYADLVNDTETLSAQRDFTRLKNKVDIISSLIEGLKLGYNADLWACMAKCGINIKHSPDNLYSDIQLAITRAKSIIEARDEAYEHLTSKMSDKSPTIQDFDLKLVALGKFTGYEIDKNTCTISKYIATKKLFDEHIKALENGRGSN